MENFAGEKMPLLHCLELVYRKKESIACDKVVVYYHLKGKNVGALALTISSPEYSVIIKSSISLARS